eukprot:m.106756 g.106756  ORF g.106756 m.106756 type:complete len:358 (+) comp9193_c0_seq1:1952-3025(+)
MSSACRDGSGEAEQHTSIGERDCCEVAGTVVRTRQHGRQLRFASILQEDKSLVQVAFSAAEFEGGDASLPFPEHRTSLRANDQVRLQCRLAGDSLSVLAWIRIAAAPSRQEQRQRKRTGGGGGGGGPAAPEAVETATENAFRAIWNPDWDDALVQKHAALDAAAHENDDDERAPKALRAQVLAQWLCDHFGVDALVTGPVLDIAGGNGMLSLHLAELAPVECIVIDPDTRDNAKTRRLQRELLARGRPVPRFLREPLSSEAHQELLASCSLVVGLHPDQATGLLVETALAAGKPFAVVPCCACTIDFPDRRLPSGGRVLTTADLIEWICAKSPAIQRHQLPFVGRNTVLYFAPGLPA